MTEIDNLLQPETEKIFPKARTGLFNRIAKYTLVKILALGLMLVIGMFVAVIVLNFGGYIDKIYRANIEESLMFMAAAMKDATYEEKVQFMDRVRYGMEEAYGLHKPFILRCVRWTADALTLRLGRTSSMTLRGHTISVVRMLLLERLPYTLLLFGVSNFVIFFMSLGLALYLFRKYEGLLDRLIVFLSPLSSIPSWLHGVFLVIIFAAVLRVLPYPRSFTRGLDVYIKHDVITLVKYMILPVTAIFLNLFFQSVYSWRTFFLMQAGEDYLDLAKAKGLPDKTIERRYLLRPSLPFIFTSFAMTMIGVWQMALILEKFFFWPGIGSLFFESLGYFPFTGGIIVLFAYLLVFTVFILDISYAFVDPRVRIGSNESIGRVARKPHPSLRQWIRNSISLRRSRLRKPSPVFRLPAKQNTGNFSEADQHDAHSHASAWKSAFGQIRRYPSAMVGLGIIAILIGVSILTVIAIPYKQALIRWRGDGNRWVNNPKFAQPAWSNWFRKDKLPSTTILDSRNGTASKEVKDESVTMKSVTIDFSFDYPYGGYPQDLVVKIDAKNVVKRPLVNLFWVTPDGREIKLDTFTMNSAYRFSYEYQWYNDTQNLLEVRSGPPPWEKLFVASGAKGGKVVQGTYQLRLQGFVFDEGADMDAEMVLYGQVYGLAGTDDKRRDLTLAILWGTPFALLFGLLGAFGTGLLAMVIAAIGVWFGGWVDVIIQRITEVNMLLPAFPMAIMIYFLYTHNIWIILGVIILLSVFGNSLKNFRAAFLQAKEAGYIEAARVYSAGNWRIILRYMVPRIIPLLVPQLVALVPSYIFLEPTLAFVGVVDPYLPTWGKILMTGLFTTESKDFIYYMNLLRNPYLALEPIGLMFLTGLAFSLLGIALDRIFNPRLRSL